MDMTTSFSGWSLQLPGSSDPESSEEDVAHYRTLDICIRPCDCGVEQGHLNSRSIAGIDVSKCPVLYLS